MMLALKIAIVLVPIALVVLARRVIDWGFDEFWIEPRFA